MPLGLCPAFKLCWQGLFVEQLYHSGMVDEVEKELLSEPIQKNERRLMRKHSLGLSHRIDEVPAPGHLTPCTRYCGSKIYAQLCLLAAQQYLGLMRICLILCVSVCERNRGESMLSSA